MTDSQRREHQRIAQRIRSLKRTIATEEEAASQFPITSYMLNRYSHAIEFHSGRLEKLERDTRITLSEMTERYEKAKEKLLKNSEKDTINITEKLEKAKEDYKKEEETLQTARKSKMQIKAELELKELEEQNNRFFGGAPLDAPTIQPSPGFSSVAEEVAEMNRRQLAVRADLHITPHPSNTTPELTPAQKEELRREKEKNIQRQRAEREDLERRQEELLTTQRRDSVSSTQTSESCTTEAIREAAQRNRATFLAPPPRPVAQRQEPEIPKPFKKPIKRVVKKEVAPGVRLYGAAQVDGE